MQRRKGAVVDVAPEQHTGEPGAERQLPDAQAHLVVADGFLGA
jgi:hypothetical protein